MIDTEYKVKVEIWLTPECIEYYEKESAIHNTSAEEIIAFNVELDYSYDRKALEMGGLND